MSQENVEVVRPDVRAGSGGVSARRSRRWIRRVRRRGSRRRGPGVERGCKGRGLSPLIGAPAPARIDRPPHPGLSQASAHEHSDPDSCYAPKERQNLSWRAALTPRTPGGVRAANRVDRRGSRKRLTAAGRCPAVGGADRQEGRMPHLPVNDWPGSRRIRSFPVWNAFGGQVMGSTARLRRSMSGSGSPVNSMRYG